MSLEIVFNKSGSAGTIANAAGWQALCDWVAKIPLEQCESLDHLCSFGYTEQLGQLEGEVKRLAKNAPSDGVAEILGTLAEALAGRADNDTGLDVTDGVA